MAWLQTLMPTSPILRSAQNFTPPPSYLSYDEIVYNGSVHRTDLSLISRITENAVRSTLMNDLETANPQIVKNGIISSDFSRKDHNDNRCSQKDDIVNLNQKFLANDGNVGFDQIDCARLESDDTISSNQLQLDFTNRIQIGGRKSADVSIQSDKDLENSHGNKMVGKIFESNDLISDIVPNYGKDGSSRYVDVRWSDVEDQIKTEKRQLLSQRKVNGQKRKTIADSEVAVIQPACCKSCDGEPSWKFEESRSSLLEFDCMRDVANLYPPTVHSPCGTKTNGENVPNMPSHAGEQIVPVASELSDSKPDVKLKIVSSRLSSSDTSEEFSDFSTNSTSELSPNPSCDEHTNSLTRGIKNTHNKMQTEKAGVNNKRLDQECMEDKQMKKLQTLCFVLNILSLSKCRDIQTDFGVLKDRLRYQILLTEYLVKKIKLMSVEIKRQKEASLQLNQSVQSQQSHMTNFAHDTQRLLKRQQRVNEQLFSCVQELRSKHSVQNIMLETAAAMFGMYMASLVTSYVMHVVRASVFRKHGVMDEGSARLRQLMKYMTAVQGVLVARVMTRKTMGACKRLMSWLSGKLYLKHWFSKRVSYRNHLQNT